jgi:ETC complex I subunit conserved region
VDSEKMTALIYQKPKNAMQSGISGTKMWVLSFLPSQAKRADPLMGWAGSGDTQTQISLNFPDLKAAMAYAQAHGIDYTVKQTAARSLKIQAYADNFR